MNILLIELIVFDDQDEEFHHETHITKDESGLEFGAVVSKVQENIVFEELKPRQQDRSCQKVREAERQKIVEQFRSNDNKLVTGSVKRVTRDNIIVDLTHEAEALLPRDKLLPGEILKSNDRVRAILQITEVEEEDHN